METWKRQLQQLKKPTPICKSCFKNIKYRSFHKLIFGSEYVCDNCIFEATPKFIEEKIDGVNALSIYEYSEFMKNKIFLYKGCEDFEMKDYFLSPYLVEMRLKYDGFIIVPIPSYKEDDIKRGYNHVVEIFKGLKLPIYECLIKTKDIKQKELNFVERQKIEKILEFDHKFSIKNKKILLVDDVITTGASMKAAIKILRNNGAKKIEILAVARRVLAEKGGGN